MTRARGLAGFASAISGPVNSTDVFVGVLTATSLTVNGSASIGGTVTYEDVTNVDSVGVITAQSGVHFGTAAAGTLVIGNNTGIGIGTVSPLHKIHVQDGGIAVYNTEQTKIAMLGEDGNLELKRPDGGYIDLGDSTSDDYDARIKLESDGELTIVTGGSGTPKRLGITSTGNVGINTDPTEKFEMVVNQTLGSRIHTNLAGSGSKFLSWVIDGGIGTNDSRAEVDFNHGGTTYGTLYTGYSTSSNTATSFVLRSLNADTHISIAPNSTTRAIFGTDGALYMGYTVGSGSAQDEGIVKARGYNTKQGIDNSLGNNNFNIFWTGSVPQLWIDTTNVGTISVSSDYRVKDNVVSITSTCIDRIKQLRPVQYEYTNYGSLFTADGVTREGFIAHEVQEVIPSGAEGVKDDPNEIQSLKVDAILSVTVKALQEAIAKIETLETKVAALEGN